MKKLYLIGNAHLDPVWMWRWQEGFAEIKATFRSALDRMKEFDDFKFTSACACYYQWVEKNAPEMFAEICERVKEGRWEIAGGWYIQPDCNIPSGESFARHSLYGQRYFREKFGIIAKTGYNVDSFGHNGNLPQILKKSGMEYYVFSRPGTHEKELPSDVFFWESQDGRGAIFADHWGDRDESCEYMDQGAHDFEYEITDFESIEKCTHDAYELNNPPFSILETFHKGTLPETMKNCSISKNNIILSAFKRAEDDCSTILRNKNVHQNVWCDKVKRYI